MNELNIKEIQEAIKDIRDIFQSKFSAKLNLLRISAPLIVTKNSGLNDNLSGGEKPLSFILKEDNETVEVVQSLAKWKRYALKKYDFKMHEGLYADMNALRCDEIPDALHSIYVDQWDWEKIIDQKERNINTLKEYVQDIFTVIFDLKNELFSLYPAISYPFAEKVFFIDSNELAYLYPDLSPKERENKIVKEKKCVFIIGIGHPLKADNKPHDTRAADYDDWNLNGDLLFYLPALDCALELSSMGIRVDAETLKKQCKITNHLERLELPYHKAVLNNELPYTIGGGIGQSRLAMLLLNRRHIGEVQASVWPKKVLIECQKEGIELL